MKTGQKVKKVSTFHVYDKNGIRTNKIFYSRYAIQRVLAREAYYISDRSIRMGRPPMNVDKFAIIKAFPYKRMEMNVKNAMNLLKEVYKDEKYPGKLAAASLGGASHSGFIEYDAGVWKRVR